MAEIIHVVLDRGEGVERDVDEFRTGEDLTLTTKDHGTESGAPIVFVSFDGQLHGEPPTFRAGFTTTVHALLRAADILRARYES